jgi:D-tyrosyl-tRNA(Tyr) deacylase
MRAVVQRVRQASVTVDGAVRGAIGPGLLILVGIAEGDTEAQAAALAEKLVHLRVFADDAGKMNRSLIDIGGECLIVSQFTLLGDVSRGRRPSFDRAAKPDDARRLYQAFVDAVALTGLRVATGEFQAHMQVSLINDGPVTLICDT